MSYVTQFSTDPKTKEVTVKGRLPHPKELQYSIEPERFYLMWSGIREAHPKWTVQECQSAALADLGQGLLGHIENVPVSTTPRNSQKKPKAV